MKLSQLLSCLACLAFAAAFTTSAISRSTGVTTITAGATPTTSILYTTGVLAIDQPMPTIVYKCANLDQVCINMGGAARPVQTLWYDNRVNTVNRARGPCAGGAFTAACKALNKCSAFIQQALDWRTTCDEFPFASTWQGGAGAAARCASKRQQDQQGGLLARIADMLTGEATPRPYRSDQRAHAYVLSLDYGAAPASLAGSLLPGGGLYMNARNAVAQTFRTTQGPTAAAPIYTPPSTTYAGNQQFTCPPTNTCARKRSLVEFGSGPLNDGAKPAARLPAETGRGSLAQDDSSASTPNGDAHALSPTPPPTPKQLEKRQTASCSTPTRATQPPSSTIAAAATDAAQAAATAAAAYAALQALAVPAAELAAAKQANDLAQSLSAAIKSYQNSQTTAYALSTQANQASAAADALSDYTSTSNDQANNQISDLQATLYQIVFDANQAASASSLSTIPQGPFAPAQNCQGASDGSIGNLCLASGRGCLYDKVTTPPSLSQATLHTTSGMFSVSFLQNGTQAQWGTINWGAVAGSACTNVYFLTTQANPNPRFQVDCGTGRMVVSVNGNALVSVAVTSSNGVIIAHGPSVDALNTCLATFPHDSIDPDAYVWESFGRKEKRDLPSAELSLEFPIHWFDNQPALQQRILEQLSL